MPLTPKEQLEKAQLEMELAPIFNEKSQAAARSGAMRGLTGGYASNIAGAAQHPIEGLRALLGRPDTGQYVKSRDEFEANMAKNEQNDPTAAFMGQLVGSAGLGAAVAPAGAVGALNKIKQGATIGAAFGGATNPGNVPGQVTPLQGEDRLKNAGIGGLIGGGIPALTEGVKGAFGAAKGVVSRAAGLSPAQGNIYSQNGPEVDAMRAKAQNNPEALQEDFRNSIKGAVDTNMGKTRFLQGERNKLFEGKSMPLDTADFEGAPPDVKTALGHIVDGAPQTNVEIPMEDAQSLKEAAQGAAKFSQAKAISTPVDYDAKRAAAGKLAHNLRTGMEAVEPEIAPFNQEIAKDTRAAQIGTKIGNANPEGLFKSNTLANKATLQRLDQDGANGLQSTADTYKTGLALNAADAEPGFIKGVSQSVARPVLRGAGAVERAFSPVNSTPKATMTLQGLIQGNKPNPGLTPAEAEELRQLEQDPDLRGR